MPPLEIINSVLLDGMKVVGELFGSGPDAAAVRAAERRDDEGGRRPPRAVHGEGRGASKGRIVLATVRGDVHDIGKNLVDIILTNNGYEVFNLGIKQPVDDILKAAVEKKADAVGMSGLLVKSVAVMKENLEEMNARGVKVPVLLGGAALTRDYAEDDLATLYGGPLLYCKDAFDGLHMMDAIAGGRWPRSAPSRRRGRQAEAAAGRVRGEVRRHDPVRAKDVPEVAKDNASPPRRSGAGGS
jgi:5-methyltetrahydrofolate--homocysteine methyltransferase